MISQLLTSNNVWYIAAASVVLLAMWMAFIIMQGDEGIEGPDQDVDLSTPAGRRSARQQRAMDRGHTRDNNSAQAASAAVPVEYTTTSFAVETSIMDVTVTVVRPQDPQITVLTLHDPTSDHRTAFNYFVKHVQTQLSSARVQQILTSASAGRRGSGSLPSGPARGMPPRLQDIAAGVTQVMAAFGVQSCIGLGVGAGATVLAQVSRQQMSAFSVLILCNPLALQGPTWQEKLQWRCINSLFALGFLDWAAAALRDVALGPSTRRGYVGQEFKAAAARLPAPAVRAYIEAALSREAVDTAALSEVWRRTKVRVLGFSGEAAAGPVTPYPHMAQTPALLQAMRCADASICAWEELPYAGACSTVDEPKRLLAALRMALYAMGYAH